MRVWTWVRLLGLWWLLPLAAAAMLIGRSGTFARHPDYAPAQQYAALESSILSFPLIALAATVAAHRIVRGGFLERVSPHPFVRGHLVPMLGIAGPSWVLALCFQIAPSLLAGAPAVVVAPLLASAAWIGAGVALGWLLGSHTLLRVAAPLAVLTVYIGAAFPAALDPPWLRHLTGLTSGCCAIYEVPDLRAAAAGVLTLGAVTGMCLAVSATAARVLPRAVTACTALGLVVAVGAGITLARPLDADAVQDRQEPMVCIDVGVPLCTWPETAQVTQEHRESIRAVTATADGAGLELPTKITQRAPGAHSWPEGTVSFSSAQGEDRVHWAYASALLPRVEACPDSPGFPDEDLSTLLALRGAVQGWLVAESGHPMDAGGLGEESAAVLDSLSGSTAHEAEAIRTLHSALLSCTVPAELVEG